MGSTARGLITGFICRLCSKMNRYVILIYGEEGERMKLAEKINSYLPITVKRHDPLPKTVCLNCVDRLENHTRMVQTITKANNHFKNHAKSDAEELGEESIDYDDDDDDDDDSELESTSSRQHSQLNQDRVYLNLNTGNSQSS